MKVNGLFAICCFVIANPCAAANIVYGQINNETSFQLKAYATTAETSGYVSQVLSDVAAGETGQFAATHSWALPIYSIKLTSLFYIVDNNGNPREDCLLQIETPSTHFGSIHVRAHCAPIVPIQWQSERVHFADDSLGYSESVVNPRVSISLREGHGPDLDRRLS